MFNEEISFLDDSSESYEHANLPRVLNLHEKPDLFNNTSKINMNQSLKLLKSNNSIFNKLTENKKIKMKSNSIKNKTLKTKNKKDVHIIDLNNGIKRTRSNFNSNNKIFKYEKMLSKTDLNINMNDIKKNYFLKSPKLKLNKNKYIKNSNIKKNEKTFDKKMNNKFLNSNKLRDSRNKKRLFNSNTKENILFSKKIKNINKKYSNDLIRNISNEKINRTNTEYKSNFNLTNKIQLKTDTIKENEIKSHTDKVLPFINNNLIKSKKKKNINNNKNKIKKKIKNNNNNNLRLTLPPSKGKNKIKENEKNKLNLKIKNKINSKITTKKEDQKNNNISMNYSQRKLENYKTEKNNIKLNNKNYISIEKNIKTMRSFKDLLKQDNKYKIKSQIKSHYVISKAGRDEYGQLKINQDTYLFIKEINGIKDFDIFGVLDGHGPEGHFVSQIVSRYIQLEFQKIKVIEKIKDLNIIYNKLSSNNFSIIKDIFINADNFLRDQEIESRNSGTTCVIVIHIGEHIICANAGDSRAILIYDKNKNGEYKIFPLSIDSKPELKGEKERIKRMGGLVEKIKDQYGKEVGPYRVWNKNKDCPGLAMSRSIGDFNGKNLGIIPDPNIIETNFDINIKYIVVCSDGVWEFLSNEDVMLLGNKFYEENNPREFCKEIYDNSVKYWQKEDLVIDDITILAVFF